MIGTDRAGLSGLGILALVLLPVGILVGLVLTLDAFLLWTVFSLDLMLLAVAAFALRPAIVPAGLMAIFWAGVMAGWYAVP